MVPSAGTVWDRLFRIDLQAGLAMNGIFEVLGENKKYIEFYNTARARRPRARADHAT